jgi:hypothetical protein
MFFEFRNVYLPTKLGSNNPSANSFNSPSFIPPLILVIYIKLLSKNLYLLISYELLLDDVKLLFSSYTPA